MKIVFACGGTAGHINPAIAVASYIKERHPDADILFIGNPNGMEHTLVPKAGFAFEPVEIMGVQRQLNWRNIKYNAKSMVCLATCGNKIKKILRDFNPDVAMGTGGYVSGPVLQQAHHMGIKTLCHEQNAFPGVANKLAAKFVDKVLLAVEEAVPYMDKKANCIVTGNPVREEILFASREKARAKYGITEQLSLLTFGGSLGARRINEAVADLIAWHHDKGEIHHIHATGAYGVELLPTLLKERSVNLQGNKSILIKEYIDDMADCLAAADLVICRAGAITLSELEMAGKASILIPSPNVAANHQYHNAMVLKNHDAAMLIEEKDLTGAQLIEAVQTLMEDRTRLQVLGNNASKLAIPDANERIYNELMALIRP